MVTVVNRCSVSMSEERIRASIIDNKVSISVSMVLDCGEYFVHE